VSASSLEERERRRIAMLPAAARPGGEPGTGGASTRRP
jgi:hypothetical protein